MVKYKKDKKLSDKIRSITIPSVSIPAARSLTWLGRLKKRFKLAFQLFDSKKEQPLSGRIHELNTLAADLSQAIEQIKENFASGGIYDIIQDPELSTFLEAIIEPLLREAASLYQSLHSQSIAEHAKAFKKFGLWIERARKWVHFFEKKRSKEELLEAVIQHLVGEALVCIDRDIEIVHEYQIHQIDHLAITAEDKERLSIHLKKAVAPHLQDLIALKKRPSRITLDGLGNWKNQIDHCRQTYFELALHTIDLEIERESPLNQSQEASEHLQEVISQINDLEDETKKLMEDVRSKNWNEPIQRQILHVRLIALAEQIHPLMLDLRLESEMVMRLQKISLELSQLELLFN